MPGPGKIQYFRQGEKLCAIVIPANCPANDGVRFLTDGNAPFQLAQMGHPAGHEIQPHRHNPVKRELNTCSEFLLIRKGKLKVDFYDDERSVTDSCILSAGDCILLLDGGHGFDCLEEVDMIEVKQGPYAGADDKTRFAKP